MSSNVRRGSEDESNTASNVRRGSKDVPNTSFNVRRGSGDVPNMSSNVDGRPIELPNIEGIVVLNLLSWGSGANPWGTAKEESPFQKPTHYDGLLEVVGISDVSRLGLIQSKLAAGTRIAQGGSVSERLAVAGSIRITTHEEWPVQVDGEPHIQPPGTITILKSALKVGITLLVCLTK
ncbi:unnamed protein product [Heligmosomoides polygyrus]|uniref:DAGKa domain-containing protein n=1 Tax=Heligmosomoides polygyrus TaxID=6339 RepID=A0A183GKL9_HELPZ|nr:unnamed protein product [Heligmosomoides polygyrus]